MTQFKRDKSIFRAEKLPCPSNSAASNAIEKTTNFSECYQPNENWMDEPGVEPLKVLRDFYPQYFIGDQPDYTQLKANVLTDSKAKELFKGLFKLPFKSIKPIHSDHLDDIVRLFGPEITAHGVEDMKGGLYNLLLMCISNKVLAPSGSWGPFVKSLPNISPLSHGPYFLIYSSPLLANGKSPHNPLFDEISYILIPFGEQRQILADKLRYMVAVDLITDTKRDAFMLKLLTYNEFLNKLTPMEIQGDPRKRKSASLNTRPLSCFFHSEKPKRQCRSNSSDSTPTGHCH
jgi:hypothetical protein